MHELILTEMSEAAAMMTDRQVRRYILLSEILTGALLLGSVMLLLIAFVI
jgi:hypothetical protein